MAPPAELELSLVPPRCLPYRERDLKPSRGVTTPLPTRLKFLPQRIADACTFPLHCTVSNPVRWIPSDPLPPHGRIRSRCSCAALNNGPRQLIYYVTTTVSVPHDNVLATPLIRLLLCASPRGRPLAGGDQGVVLLLADDKIRSAINGEATISAGAAVRAPGCGVGIDIQGRDERGQSHLVRQSRHVASRNHHDFRTGTEIFRSGLRLVYAFNHEGGHHRIHRGLLPDPDAPMPYWGVALSLGPNIIAPWMPKRKPAADAIHKAAARLVGHPRERAYVEALATLLQQSLRPERAG